MAIFTIPLLLNLFLLPFYVTKFPRRFLVTWHLIPLLLAQWGFWGVLMIVGYLHEPAQESITVILSDFLTSTLAAVLVSVVAFFLFRLVPKGKVLPVTDFNNTSFLEKHVPLLLLRYYTILMLIYSVPTFLASGLAPARFGKIVAILLISSILLHWYSRRQLRQLYTLAEKEPQNEQLLKSSDFAYLVIPLSMSAIAATILIILGK